MRRRILYLMFGALLTGSLVIGVLAVNVHQSIIANLPASPTFQPSTVPANGDGNPYGVAFVPPGFPAGPLGTGDILVSNFNDSAAEQGTGSTIVSISADGTPSLFFQGATQLGLTTALGVLRRGFVLVGSLPTSSGTVVPPGSLLIIDHNGNVVTTLVDSQLLDGPWDLTVHDLGGIAQVFVSNVLTGTVTRLDLKITNPSAGVIVQHMTQIASGYSFRTDPAALVIGPTGVAFDAVHNILYVASTGDNAIYAIPNAATRTSDAGTGTIIYQDSVHLHGPLALALAPNGDLISAQGDAVNPDATQLNEIVEFTPAGQFVAQFQVDPGAAGAAFGLAVARTPKGIVFAAVNDNLNALDVWDLM
jgi:hypothetical protein